MNASQSRGLQLPQSLEVQLGEFRRRVWTIKSIEAACGALFGVVVGYLGVYLLDRVVDTPTWARLAFFLASLAACGLAPLYLHRWIWQQRTLDQLARLLSRTFPSLGDQMLGIIELVRNEFEQNRSRALCEAAIRQVAEDASHRDFNNAVPRPRHRFWIGMAAAPAIVAVLLLALYPAAATNAWARFLAPWRDVPRYTFTALAPLPDRLVVPHGEAVTVPVRLLEDSKWQPAAGEVQLGSQPPLKAELRDGQYAFALPPQIDAGRMKLAIGDARQRLTVEPMLRPDLSGVTASVQLPEYLGRPQPLEKDVRGGTVSLVQGSVATFTANANRALAKATIDNQPAAPKGTAVASAPQTIQESRKLVFHWQDEFGLAGPAPFTVSINAREDEAPSLASDGLPRMRVVLDSETLAFQVRAQDDFGVQRVGIEWNGADANVVSKPAKGERLLATGGHEKESLELGGTFCAQTLGIEPQPLEVRLFVEDYLPDRERVYSPTYLLYVLSAEQHAIWVTEQLSKWHRQSLEVRDREMQLHHTNQQLRLLDPAELNQPEVRRQIENQSAGEKANGRRLTGLVSSGEDLIRQAMRNPEFGVGHLETWAEMLAILKDIAGTRMPNVADLLKQSAQSPAAQVASKPNPQAGQIRSQPGSGGSGDPPKPAAPKPPVPAVVDAESSQHPGSKDAQPPGEPSKSNSQPRLTLPVTTMADSSPPKAQPPQPPAAQKLDEAVKAQADLLAEFDKIAEELNRVLANLEGSTLVKRLKAASRKQYVIGGKMGDLVGQGTGNRGREGTGNRGQGTAGGGSGNSKQSPAVPYSLSPVPSPSPLEQLATQEWDASKDLSHIMDDMEAYFERRRYQRFKSVLDEMRKQDAVGSLRQLGDDLQKEKGLSIAQTEFWSDTFDRWADDLVDPACAGKCPGGKSKASLPPSIVLEAMQILEAEVNLREETRVTEQARAGLVKQEYGDRAEQLSKTQDTLSDRVAKLTVRIRELPEGEAEFGYEIGLLGQVEQVMDEATQILARPDTGREAIGAETEAIELLLKSKKINPRGGGGGGGAPGGGGSGSTLDSALALLGTGRNDQEVREERDAGQATGQAGTALPEEFRTGLDQYFNRLERDGGR